MSQETEEIIHKELHPEEKLLWSGKPRHGIVFHRVSIFLVVLTVILLGSVAGAVLLLNDVKETITAIEHFRAGPVAGIVVLALFGSSFGGLSLILLWGFIFNPIQRRRTSYALTDRRLITISGLLNPKARSFDLSSINFISLTEPTHGKATIIFGQVDPVSYGLTDPVRKQRMLNSWKWFGYRFELFEVGWPVYDGTPHSARHMVGRFELIENARMVYNMLREATDIRDIKRPNDISEPGKTGRYDTLPEAIRRPSLLTFVVDVSGSMDGDKLEQAKQGLRRALASKDQNNQVGLLTFNDTIITRIPVAPLTQNCNDLMKAIGEMKAGGQTALYDAIKAGIEMTDAAPGAEDAVRAVVVLTDGEANDGKTHLDNIIRLMSRDGVAIEQFTGLTGDGTAEDKKGRRVNKKDIIGIGLAMPTGHPVQIFFIGIGEDADMEIGRILSRSTGAEFQRVTEKTLARVLEEFKYF
ncbi:MAG: VWA domain-containing protein [Chloroflexi bacterium]|nr:VWA domain-containing protein [Chloroflexota bacterium]